MRGGRRAGHEGGRGRGRRELTYTYVWWQVLAGRRCVERAGIEHSLSSQPLEACVKLVCVIVLKYSARAAMGLL